MCAAFGSALGKEKIKMKKEDVKMNGIIPIRIIYQKQRKYMNCFLINH